MNVNKIKTYTSIILFTVVYVFILIVFYLAFEKLGITEKIVKYIMFDTDTYKFQEFLSIGITVLAIFVGAMLTIATVLMSMCDKRIIKLIKKYNKGAFLIKSIRLCISSGIISTCLFAGVYAKLDFNMLKIRLISLALSVYLLIIFLYKSSMLIKIILNILNDSFVEDNSIFSESKLKIKDGKKIKEEKLNR